MTDVAELRRILEQNRTIAMVGLSDKPYRPSYFAGKYMMEHGYQVVPVNPVCDEIFGLTCYPSLADIPFKVDLVDCFRRSEEMPMLAQQAIDIKASVFWMQLSIENTEAKALASKAGLDVVMDRCVKIEHARLFGGLNWVGVNTGIISAKRPRQVHN